jgi:peptidoglycan/LPS O-acetylase OafA/YrhL
MEHKIYFKNLNSLRFIAALIVLLSHVGQLLNVLGVAKSFSQFYTSPIQGELGVILFFALSGFLITYLLLAEEKISGTINVKAFYIRRALRIWPLYFLLIFLALFIFPFIDGLTINGYERATVWSRLGLKIFFYCIFMPGIVMDFLGFIPYATHTWTIGAEEQFYFIWPWLFKKINNKLLVFIVVLLVYLLVYYILKYFPAENKFSKIGFLIWSRYPISCMAIGGLYGYLAFVKTGLAIKIKLVLFKLWCQLAITAILIVLAFTGYYFAYLNNEIYSLLLGYQVFNLAVNPTTFFSLENKVFNYLGKISYGIYMFHPLAIAGAIKLCLLIHLTQSVILYLFSLLIAVALAAVSYHFYEKFFIKKKPKYSVVISGDNAK